MVHSLTGEPRGVDVVRVVAVGGGRQVDPGGVGGEQVGRAVLALVADEQGRRVLRLGRVIRRHDLERERERMKRRFIFVTILAWRAFPSFRSSTPFSPHLTRPPLPSPSRSILFVMQDYRLLFVCAISGLVHSERAGLRQALSEAFERPPRSLQHSCPLSLPDPVAPA